ncbi:MAG: gliding motility-associated ABC transporter substrate-binding protein GldG [Chitinophagaceae bacterium]|nr:gliding motility-associated ABC transporter substrate-binding protein GldG [Chitinophagaceae bacterium]
MKKGIEKIVASKYWLIWLLLLLAAINYLASDFHARLDLTKEKRYTLSKTTKDLLRNLDDDMQIDVFLKGDFPAGFRKLANSTNDFLRLLKDRTGKIHYRFISPQEKIEDAETFYGDTLAALGAIPINLTVQKEAGKSTNVIFPVAWIHYKGKQELVNLYPGASSRISQEEINSAEALMEYQFVKAFDRITQEKKRGVAYATGNGEPVDARVYDLSQSLQNDYEFRMLDLKTQPRIPDAVDVLLIVKPTEQFAEAEKLKIDQFVMHGGKLLCFIDNLIAEQDSLSFKPETIAFDRNLNLTDLFFKYGVRINTDLVMDLQCDLIPFVVGGNQDNPQIELLHWNYFPLLMPGSNKLNKNMGYVTGHFVNSIDTIQADAVRKTPLLVSSPNSRIISTPALISLNENKNVPQDEQFRRNAIPVAMLLEGKFTSLYKNRSTQAQRDSLTAYGIRFNNESDENKMIIVSDGDIVFNDYIPDEQPGQPPVPLPMGWNKYTYREYMNQTEAGKLFVPAANRDFFINCVEYLVNNAAIAETRNKDIVLRLLDSKKVKQQKVTWQFINIALPVLLILLSGLIYQQIRRRKYAS